APQPSATRRDAAGQVTATDRSTLTISTAGGPQTVTTTSSTRVTKTTAAAQSDVTVGSKVHVDGAPAGDGSVASERVHINASSDQIGRASCTDRPGDADGRGDA